MHALPFPGPGIPFDDRAQSRALVGCVLASLVLHAVVLFLLPGIQEGSRASAPVQVLSAVLSPRSAPLSPLPSPETVTPPQRPEPPRPTVKPETPRPVLTAPVPSPSAPVIAAPPSAPAPVAPPVAATPPPQPAVAPRPAESQAPAAPSAGALREGSDSADAGTLERYRMDLISTANKYYKRYPAQAMEKGWQGKVEVRLQLGSNGMIKSATVKTSSGYAVLDAQAVDMITKAKGRLVAVPPSLRGREFVVDVPVIFDLKTG